MTIDARLKNVFADTFEVPSSEIHEDKSMDTCETWDSLRTITLAFSIEQEFGIEFTDQELLTIDSYASVRRLLEAKGLFPPNE